jgi:hypothetical protein
MDSDRGVTAEFAVHQYSEPDGIAPHRTPMSGFLCAFARTKMIGPVVFGNTLCPEGGCQSAQEHSQRLVGASWHKRPRRAFSAAVLEGLTTRSIPALCEARGK